MPRTHLIKVSVTWWVPGLDIIRDVTSLGNGRHCLLADPRIAALVECPDGDVEAGILPDDLHGVLVCIEAVHQNQRNIGRIFLVEILNLLDCQVKEGQV